ncbi:MAG: hypothetical protein HFG00_12010, partial [Oscillibacter sp.]|nr:hypothetical protein [Oscillibacter sp.]
MSDLFEYKKEMSALRFTEEQKKALAKAAAAGAGNGKRRRPVFRTALLAAAVAAALAVGAVQYKGKSCTAAKAISNICATISPIFIFFIAL